MRKYKPLPQLKKEAQRVVNKYVRLRDAESGFFKCISCGNVFPISQMDGGHFFSGGSYDLLRYDPRNINGQCRVKCNNLLEGNFSNYAENLRIKIGQAEFDDLCKQAKVYKQGLHFWKPWELEDIIKYFKQKTKEEYPNG